jgi:GDP/UDP-N,N'-diacetylbacillosamine 2-epimerase (hydrolysing)
MKKICYVSGTRADFGLISSTLIKASKHPDLDVSVCITGMHALDSIGDLGRTAQEVIDSGLKVCGTVKTDVLSERSDLSMAQAISKQISGFTEIFDREKFDLIVVLGDRGEMLAGAIVGLHLGIPVAHIHGGELSGTIDEPVRHAISKLSHYHFVSTQGAKTRLTRMGEREENIFCVGAPGLDDLVGIKFKNKDELFQSVGFDQTIKTCLIAYHPVVQEMDETKQQIIDLLETVKSKGLQAIILMPNTDAGSKGVVEGIELYRHHPLFRVFDHLSREYYLSWLNACDFLVGNSSSGIIESCTLQKPTLDIGSRQRMRETSQNVWHVSNCPDEISKTLDHLISTSNHPVWENVYGDGKSGERIVNILANLKIEKSVLNKLNTY